MADRKIKIEDETRVVTVGLALGHRMRVALLVAHANDGAASATVLSRAGIGTLNNVSYHQRRLVELGALELTRSRQGRGALEHHYELSEFGERIVRLAQVIGRER